MQGVIYGAVYDTVLDDLVSTTRRLLGRLTVVRSRMSSQISDWIRYTLWFIFVAPFLFLWLIFVLTFRSMGTKHESGTN
ncbi:hypothetical protein OG21DRAFT_1510710 [Imleria badia]|nr:hypothetical protein OG21DRAFT_1510710 [Imleria badia]